MSSPTATAGNAGPGRIPARDLPVPYSLTAKAEAALDSPAWPGREDCTTGPGDGSGPGFTTTSTTKETP